MATFRAFLASRWTRIALLIVVGAVAVSFVLSRLPQPIEGVVRIDECASMTHPVIAADDAWWRGALPQDAQRGAPNQMPIASWPDGLSYDAETGTVGDPEGTVRFRRGADVRIRGVVFEARGDPSPCYYNYSVRIEHIEAATP